MNFRKKVDPPNPPPPPPKYPKSHSQSMTQAVEWKSSLICFISSIREKTHKVWFKNLWIRLSNDIWLFGPSPRPQGGREPPKNCAVACAILGWISEKKNWLAHPPTVPTSPAPGAWHRRPNENPVCYVLYLSFVSRHTKFGLKIFETDFVIEI